MVDIKIKRMYELSDDLQNIMISNPPYVEPQYSEIYSKKIVVDVERQAFTLRAKTFYKIILSHIPQGAEFILSSKLSCAGVIYNYNKITKQLFIYNCTQNQIYIEKNESIGEIYDG